MTAGDKTRAVAPEHDTEAEYAQRDLQLPRANGVQPDPGNGEPDMPRDSTLYELSQQLLTEADRLAKSIMEDARSEAEAEAARIRAKAEAEVRQGVVEPAKAEAAERSRDILDKAEEEARRIKATAETEAGDIVEVARRKSRELETKAEITVRDMTDSFRERIDAATNKLNNLLSAESDGQIQAPDIEADQSPDASLRAPLPHQAEILPESRNITPRVQGYDTGGRLSPPSTV